MDKLDGRTAELKQKISNLRRKCNEYDGLLKVYSVHYMDLTPNIQKHSDELAQFKRTLGLHAMDSVFLNEFHCIRTAANIEKKSAIHRIKYRNEQTEKELFMTNRELAFAKKFIDTMRNDFKHVSDVDRVLATKNRSLQDLNTKKMEVKSRIKIDLDRVLIKIEKLKS